MLLEDKAFQEIRKWVYRNAREIELSIWKFHFEGGSVDNVLQALAFYQNEDGGFGNSLEPDNWNPNSSPYTTLAAIKILKEMKFFDIKHPIYVGIMKYLESEAHFNGGLWMFTIPTNDHYPHAPWWHYSEENNKVEGIGLTAEISAFVFEFFDKDSPLYKKSIKAVTNILDKLMDAGYYGDMGVGGYITLLEKMRELGIPGFDYETVQNKLNKLVHDTIEYDQSKWEFYGVRPSNYIVSPDSQYYKDNQEILHKELDYLIQTRPQNNVWNITWSWFENNEKYAKEVAISENWWKANKAIEKLVFLNNFKRLESCSFIH